MAATFLGDRRRDPSGHRQHHADTEDQPGEERRAISRTRSYARSCRTALTGSAMGHKQAAKFPALAEFSPNAMEVDKKIAGAICQRCKRD